MPRIDVPDGQDDVTQLVWQLRPLLGEATARMKRAAFEESDLPPRLRELVRLRIAQINGCRLCLAFRDPAAAADGIDDLAIEAVGRPDADGALDVRERLAIDFAERFALDHRSLDDGYFASLRRHFDDGEILDLTFCVARHVAFGRLTTVLGLDDSCPLPGAGPAHDDRAAPATTADPG